MPFLQRAVAQFDVINPDTGEVFPKLLPKACFPDRPDDAMEAWYEGVAERLKREALEDAPEHEPTTRVRVEVDEPNPRTSSEDNSADDRTTAAKYFDDPLNRKARTRPTFMRHVSRASPRQYVEDRGRAVAHHVRHMLSPLHRRKSGRDEYDSYSDDDATPVAAASPHIRYTHKRPHAPRREDSLSSTDSDSESDGPPSRRRTPVLRHRRSHDPPVSPREYFPAYEDRRYSHDAGGSEYRRQDGPPPVYGPTKSPLFATQVAQMQARDYHERRPSMPPRTAYPAQAAVRYSTKPRSPREADPPYVRERDGYEASGSSAAGSRRRRRSDEYPRSNREFRERVDSGRVKSHDRLKDEWDAREGSRDRERERDRPRTHRYVAGVDGVGGRRYPVEQGWR